MYLCLMVSNKALPDHKTKQMINYTTQHKKNTSMSLIWLNLAIVQVW